MNDEQITMRQHGTPCRIYNCFGRLLSNDYHYIYKLLLLVGNE